MATALDLRSHVEIPGGIRLEAQFAGPIPRAIAFLIDLSIRAVVMAGTAFLLFLLGTLGIGLWLILLFLIEWFYPVLFEVFWKGQTPGKRAMQIAVVQDDLNPVTFGPSLVRNLLRAVDFLPSFYLFGLISSLCNRRFQRLGDLAAGTVVISLNRRRIDASPSVSPRAPRYAMTRDEQLATINFLQRRNSLSSARQEELAALLKDLDGLEGSHRVEELSAHAAWFQGQR